uniref:Uncharacterized protein n=1 Tax=Acrobeloides nanus TaxID=290746 RepID=A0A914DKC8_9BILA
MKKLANKILIEEKRQTVLVHRRFEIETDLPMPQNKRE